MGESGMTAQAEIQKEPVATVTPAAYNALVAAARLRDIRLLKADFLLDPNGIENQEHWKLSQACEIQHAEYNAEAELLIAWIEAVATCKLKNKKAVSIRCRYIVVYDVQGHPESAAVNAFAARVARFAAYPYFRSHVAEVSSQAGLSLPPLPVIKEIKIIPNLTEKSSIAPQ